MGEISLEFGAGPWCLLLAGFKASGVGSEAFEQEQHGPLAIMLISAAVPLTRQVKSIPALDARATRVLSCTGPCFWHWSLQIVYLAPRAGRLEGRACMPRGVAQADGRRPAAIAPLP